MGKVLVQYTRGGKRKNLGEQYARILERVGLVHRVDLTAEEPKKKRGRPKKSETAAGEYSRRDLRAED